MLLQYKKVGGDALDLTLPVTNIGSMFQKHWLMAPYTLYFFQYYNKKSCIWLITPRLLDAQGKMHEQLTEKKLLLSPNDFGRPS